MKHSPGYPSMGQCQRWSRRGHAKNPPAHLPRDHAKSPPPPRRATTHLLSREMSLPNKSPDHDLLLQKMGRNLLLFQKTEHVLKSLLELGSLSFSMDGWILPELSNGTLGQSVTTFRENHLSGKGPDAIAIKKSWRLSFGFSIDEPDLAEALQRLVSDRNQFVHHFPKEFSLETEEGRVSAVARLDEQHDQYHPLLSRLREYHRDLREDFRKLCDHLGSPAGRLSLFLPEVRESDLIKRLSSIAPSLSNHDGWSSLVAACSAIQHESPSLISETLKIWEIKSVDKLMMASKLFDLKAEPTPMGGTRILYRNYRAVSCRLALLPKPPFADMRLRMDIS